MFVMRSCGGPCPKLDPEREKTSTNIKFVAET